MANFIANSGPKDTISVRQFNISQYDLLGSTQVCTAIAVVAARELHRANGNFDAVFGSDTQVMELLSEGVVWHSRWLALDTNGTRTAFEADTESEDADPNLVSMATPDEICALPAMTMDVTDVRYEGTLIPQPGREHFGISVTEAVRNVFFPPERKPFEDDNDSAPTPNDATADRAAEDTKKLGAETFSSPQTNGHHHHSQTGTPQLGETRTPPPRPPSPQKTAFRSSSVGANASDQQQQQARDAKASIKRLVTDFSLFGRNAGKSKKDDGVDTYIFTSRGYSTLIARKGMTGMVFDSHQRDKRGMANKEEGKAVCVFCDGPNALARYLRALYGTKPLSLFTLQQVVPKECTEEMQYGAASIITKPRPATPPQPPANSVGALTSASSAAANRIAELSSSLMRLGSGFFKEG